jgi:hypothetical protein
VPASITVLFAFPFGKTTLFIRARPGQEQTLLTKLKDHDLPIRNADPSGTSIQNLVFCRRLQTG